MTKKIYSGFFLRNAFKGKHITWEFNPDACTLPEDIIEGEILDVEVTQRFSYNGFEAYAAKVNGLSKAKNGKPIHITMNVPEGKTPGEVGFLMDQYPERLEEIKPFKLSAEAGFFKVPA